MTRHQLLPKALSHELPMYDMFGGQYVMGISRFVKIMKHPRAFIFLILGAFLLFATDPNDLRSSVGLPASLIIFTIGVGTYALILVVILGLFSLVWDRLGVFFMYTPISSSIGMLIAFALVTYTTAVLTGGQHSSALFPVFFNLMGAGLVLELIFVRFVMPGILPDNTAVSGNVVTIGNRRIPISKLLHIVSQEHYVQVTLINDSFLVRARLADVVAQTTPAQGLQPHRSWWVAATSTPKLIKSDGRTVLQLSDGAIVPIAKARQGDVQDWLDLYSDWQITARAAE